MVAIACRRYEPGVSSTWISSGVRAMRDFRQRAEKLWPWLTDPDRLRQWSPIVPDRALDSVGPREVRENPDHEPVTGDVVGVDPPHELVHRWGDDVVRWRLSPTDTGCRLTLEQTMRERDHAAMNAAGWQLCLDVLDDVVNGLDRPRVFGRQDAAAHGWEVLRDKYSDALGGLGLGLRAVENGFDVVAVRVADERAEVAGVILRPDPRRVQ